MTRIIILLAVFFLFSFPAFGDFTIEEIAEDLDELSVMVFPLIVSSQAFENTEEETGAFYDDPESRYLRCPSPVLEKAMRFGQLISYGVRYSSKRNSGNERELELTPVALLLDRLRLRKIEDYEGATRCWFTFVSMMEDIAKQREGKPRTVEHYWEAENLGEEFYERLWDLVRLGVEEHLEELSADKMKPLPQTYTARVSSIELLEYSFEDGELYIKLDMWFEEIDEEGLEELLTTDDMPSVEELLLQSRTNNGEDRNR